ncbi:MAG: DUF4129 domain-containing protein [Lewinellaceae bacterium]|nr:DUF4129 domain-containing protein [Saprospiraceae bacterium]MCB9332986.1 DUF4129 domain-containing protein [Lewinellaceae bacterium]
MKKMLILCLFALPGVLGAQDAASVVEKRPVSTSQWERAAQELDYSRDVPEAKKEKKKKNSDAPSGFPNPFDSIDTQFWGTLFQFLAILIAVAAIGYGVYRMMQEPRNKRIARDGAEITVENLEAYLHETDLDQFLREALARRDFSQAVRIYFLQIIKQLSESGAIRWSKEKTNRDYLREMRPHPQYESFRGLTRSYERIWYGNVTVDEKMFSEIEPGFKALITKPVQ